MEGTGFNSEVELSGYTQLVTNRFEQGVASGFRKEVEVNSLFLFILPMVVECHSRGGYPDFNWKDGFTSINQIEGGMACCLLQRGSCRP